MKKFWRENRIIIGLFVFWRLFLWMVEIWIAPLISLRSGFLGPSPWANMDGVHYLMIATQGYFQYGQAFFPLYPLLIRLISHLLTVNVLISGLIISHLSILGASLIFFKLAKEEKIKHAWLPVAFLLFFPTSFFFASVYTESLFLFLAMGTIYASRKRNWLLAGILGGLASATRLFGVLLLIIVIWEYLRVKKKKIIHILAISLIPIGLLLYMYSLWINYQDPLAFFHVQPAFGANRSGSTFIILPQVIWRYLKIFSLVPITNFSYQIAGFEMATFFAGICLFYIGYRQKLRTGYLFYSLAALILPSLTGTLSSVPRYFLSIFPLFMVLAQIRSNLIKSTLAIIFISALIICSAYYLRGYFIA